MNIYDLPIDEALGEGKPHLVAYIQDAMPGENEQRPAVVVYPGGGYEFLSEREADPVALEFYKRGYQAFILYYSVLTAYPKPLLDSAKALNMIRDHAREWHVNPEKIAVCGFSAGGHCAAMISCLWNEPVISDGTGLSNEKARPNASILCYPVITSEKGHCHEGSIVNLMGDNKEITREQLSLENRVTEGNPPTFIWHTSSDNAVPVCSSYRMANALTEHHVPVEMHIFPHGCHGLALARRRTAAGSAQMEEETCAQWIDLCNDWLKRVFGE